MYNIRSQLTAILFFPIAVKSVCRRAISLFIIAFHCVFFCLWESSSLWLSNSPAVRLLTCPVSTCQHFVVHSVFFFFFPQPPDQQFPSISSDSPHFYLHFCIQEFYYRVRAFVSLVCMVFRAECVSAWHVGMERFFFLFPSCTEAGKERYCVRTCLCEAFPNSLRNLSANKASFFWLMSRQSVQQCYTLHTNGSLVGCAIKVSSIRTCTYSVAWQSFLSPFPVCMCIH